MGGKVTANRQLDMSLNPAWRDALVHFSILDQRGDSYKRVEEIEASYAQMRLESIPLLDKMSVNSAAYLNEVSLDLRYNINRHMLMEMIGKLQ
jgi:hypothetical protein